MADDQQIFRLINRLLDLLEDSAVEQRVEQLEDWQEKVESVFTEIEEDA